MTKTAERLEQFRHLPISGVSSNEPYAVGPDPLDANIRQAVRDEFIENPEAGWPENNYPLLSEEEFRTAERQLLVILNGIIESESVSPAEEDVAYEQVAIKLAEVYRHLEVIRGLGSVAARKELSRERAGTMTLEIFGEPDKQVFGTFLTSERSKAAEISQQESGAAAQIAREFLALTGEGEGGEADVSLELTDEAMENIREDFTVLYPGAKEFFDQEVQGDVSPEAALPYFDHALTVLGLAQKGWKAVSSNGRACETKGPKKELWVGKNRGPFSAKSIIGVAWHEALHALRYQNMTEQELSVAQSPLPGNVEFEEGALTSVEQMITGERRVAGLAYYMSLGYQLNLDNGSNKRRDFRETHEIMWRRALLQSHKEGKDITQDDILKAKRTAFQTVIRTTRGNSLDARDISYFEGGRKATKWFNEIATLPAEERRAKLRKMLSAKFDPTNPIQDALFDEPPQTN